MSGVRVHDFYRRYFDKAPKTNPSKVISPQHTKLLEPPSLEASFNSKALRIPKSSKAYSPKLRKRERTWDKRFNVTYSKDNRRLPRPLREYFDAPVDYSPELKSYNTSMRASSLPRRPLHSQSPRQSSRLPRVQGIREGASDTLWKAASPGYLR